MRQQLAEVLYAHGVLPSRCPALRAERTAPVPDAGQRERVARWLFGLDSPDRFWDDPSFTPLIDRAYGLADELLAVLNPGSGSCAVPQAEVDRINSEWERERAELRRLAQRHDLDNHHNAALCPYCTPTVDGQR